MKLGVIDIGSNTIKMTVFDIGLAAEEIFSKTFHTKLSAHIENSILTDKGIKALCEALSSLKRSARSFGCKKQNIYAFATACIRGAKNRDAVLCAAEKATKIKIMLLSGEREAELCLMGALMSQGCPTKGILADLGGGSCEFISFSDASATQKVSLNIGALKMKMKFASGKYITKDELVSLCAYLKKEISEKASKIELPSDSSLVLTGGTARATVKMISSLRKDEPSLPYVFSLSEAKELCEKSVSGELISLSEKLIKERAQTLSCGLAVFITSAEVLGADSFTVVSGGARSGFANLIKEKGRL